MVVDHDRSRVVWAAEGKTGDVLGKFFAALGPERCAQLRVVTMDMSQAYAKAVTEACPQAVQVLNRFHVQRLVHDALDEVRRAELRRKLDEWLAWARRSRLAPFCKLARTIQRATGGILAYIRTGLSNGRTEALNGKTRTLTRRSYGFHSASALIALILLCCSGISLQPVHNWPV